MFELTNEELTIYNDKKHVLQEMLRVFGVKGSFPRADIYNKFTFKEWISPDFQDNLYPEVVEYTGRFNQNFFYNQMFNQGALRKLEGFAEREYILNIFLKAIARDGFSGYDFENILKITESICANDIGEEVRLEKLFQYNIFSKVSSGYRDKIYEYLDKILSNGKFSNTEELIAYIQKTFPEYRGLSLIIMNKQVDISERVKCLKKIYKQKDLPAFKEHLRNNMTDLEVLDVFIEATIFQNNRVHEKEVNLIRLWKDIFIGSSYSSKRIYDRISNYKVEFSKKYVKYILDAKFIHKMYTECVSSMSTQQYNREENWKEFLILMTCSLNTGEIIDAAGTIPELRSLGDNFPRKFKYAVDIDDIDSQLAYLRVFSNWAVTIDPDSLWKSILSKNIDPIEFIPRFEDQEAFDTFYREYCLINYNKSVSYGVLPSEIDDDIMDNIICNIKNFHKLKVCEDDVLDTIGVSVEKYLESKLAKHSPWQNKVNIASIINIMASFYEAVNKKLIIMDEIFESIPSNSKDPNESFNTIRSFTEHAISRFYSIFEDENTSRNLMNYVMSLQDSAYKYVETKSNPKNIYSSSIKVEIVEIYTKLIKIFVTSGENCYNVLSRLDPSMKERGEIFSKNMKEALDAIELICCFNG